MLYSMATEGLLDGVGGGPPCSSVSRARHIRRRPGPRPVRGRHEGFWGLPDLTPAEHARVAEANTLWLNFWALCEAVTGRGGLYWMEHPEDPGCAPFPSVWICEELVNREERIKARRSSFDQ